MPSAPPNAGAGSSNDQYPTVSVGVGQDGTEVSDPTRANALALQSFEARGHFVDGSGMFELSAVHRWRNPHNNPVVGRYNIHLDARAVVSDLIVKVGGRSILGSLSPADSAQSAFGAAMESDTFATVLSKISDTVYQVQVGFVRPSESVEVECHYQVNTTSVPADKNFVVTYRMQPYAPPRHREQALVYYLSEGGSYVRQRLSAAEYKALTDSGRMFVVANVGVDTNGQAGVVWEKMFIQYELAAQYVQGSVIAEVVGMSTTRSIVASNKSVLVRV